MASSLVLAAGCARGVDAQAFETGPLEAALVEILPTAEDLYIDLLFGACGTEEETTYFSDGLTLHSRFIGNEDSFAVPDESKVLKSVFLSMALYVYEDEARAIERIHEEKESRLYEKVGDTEYYAEMLGFPSEEVAGYDVFWEEPRVPRVQGEEVVFFRVGRYVGRYRVHVDDPPSLEDGHFIPPDLHELLKSAILQTIPKLRAGMPHAGTE